MIDEEVPASKRGCDVKMRPKAFIISFGEKWRQVARDFDVFLQEYLIIVSFFRNSDDAAHQTIQQIFLLLIQINSQAKKI